MALGRIAVKFLHVDVWTNLALRRVLKVLPHVSYEPGAPFKMPPLDNLRKELTDLLARRRAEGVGKVKFGVWEEAAKKTARAKRRKGT